MGAGRKTETVVVQNKPPPQQSSNLQPWSSRNLWKKDLAAVIFGCKHSTYHECIFKSLFGLPAGHILYVQNVHPGMPLFLFNYSDRKLHGIFEATSHGQMGLSKFAWTSDGEETSFPAQVRVKVRMLCRPLTEEQFKPVLIDNYNTHEPNHFWFELDKVQTNQLIALFSASPINQSIALPRTTAKWGNLFRQAVAPMISQEESSGKNQTVVIEDVAGKQGTAAICYEGKAWSSLFKPHSDSKTKKEDEDSNSGVSNMSEDYTSPAMPEAHCVDEAPPVLPESICVDEAPHVMPEAIYVDEAPLLSKTCVDEACVVSEMTIPWEVVHFTEDISPPFNSEYHTVLNKLIQAIGEMNAFQLGQTQKIRNLEQELAGANKRIQELESYYVGQGTSQDSGHQMHLHSTEHIEELQIKKPFKDPSHSMLLVGGFSGSSWLQNLDLYIPPEDVIQSLEPMSFVRSYASALKFKDSLYVIGGGYSSSWFDSVESYNLEKQQWISCPSLSRKKGSLAGVSLCDKIYAIGGGDASECFSEMEVLNVDIGKWFLTSSMQHKRVGPAASQLNGALYVVGGYDGNEYLKSVERFDPRQYSWTSLKSMNSRRGCHSVSVLNEKLYAIGGYDGTQMVPTIEVFEPRVGSWMLMEPMKYARGYMGCVTLGDTIYVLGGMQENDEILDTVECYCDGQGWQLADLKSVGRRCFFSAVAV